MLDRDQISHVRVVNPSVRRQWVPIRACSVTLKPQFVSAPGPFGRMDFARVCVGGHFTVSRRLARRITKAALVTELVIVLAGGVTAFYPISRWAVRRRPRGGRRVTFVFQSRRSATHQWTVG